MKAARPLTFLFAITFSLACWVGLWILLRS